MLTFKPYIKCRLSGDQFDGNFSNGLTMTGSETTFALENVTENIYTDGKDHLFTLHSESDNDTVRYFTSVENRSDAPIGIEMISSFTCHLSEFDRLWRLQSFWSAEGKIKVDSVVDLHLTPSWSGGGVRSEKFFNLGSMPVHGSLSCSAAEMNTTFPAVLPTLIPDIS